ncbi:hypothetical protein [Dyella acidisoli]|uniref:DUF4190 domain-containing protein n=1 Tax=Dyella acidisoli TaxID=1867834 RepID=A0ABQ5XRL3_9GAMM|nr:hypothetical protein [Dyella acidisoli]GLQ93668.1 hypothetical protein GCM10007901_26190 [Dyella acidisoli]
MNSVPPYEPPRAQLSESNELQKDHGSLGLGIGLAWAIAILGSLLGFVIITSFYAVHSSWIAALFLLPYLLIVILAVFQYRTGKTRTGLGLMLGLLSIIAVALLLVAACFGMLRGGIGD